MKEKQKVIVGILLMAILALASYFTVFGGEIPTFAIGGISYHFIYDEDSGTANPVFKAQTSQIGVQSNTLDFVVDDATDNGAEISSNSRLRLKLNSDPLKCTYSMVDYSVNDFGLGQDALFRLGQSVTNSILYPERHYYSLQKTEQTKFVNYTLERDSQMVGTGSFDAADISSQTTKIFNDASTGGYIAVTPTGINQGSFSCPSAADVLLIVDERQDRIYVVNKQDYKTAMQNVLSWFNNYNLQTPPDAADFAQQVVSKSADPTARKLVVNLRGDATANLILEADGKFFSAVVEVSEKLSRPEFVSCEGTNEVIEGQAGNFYVRVKNGGEGTTAISVIPDGNSFRFSPPSEMAVIAPGAEKVVSFAVQPVNYVGTETIQITLKTTAPGGKEYTSQGSCQLRGIRAEDAQPGGNPLTDDDIKDAINDCLANEKDYEYNADLNKVVCKDRIDYTLIGIVLAVTAVLLGGIYLITKKNKVVVRYRKKR